MKNIEILKDYDAAEFLDSDDLIKSYLSEVFSDGDEFDIKIALSNVARAKNITDLAIKMDINRDDLCKLLFDDEKIEMTYIKKFLHVVGISINDVLNTESAIL